LISFVLRFEAADSIGRRLSDFDAWPQIDRQSDNPMSGEMKEDPLSVAALFLKFETGPSLRRFPFEAQNHWEVYLDLETPYRLPATRPDI
jgi:hypothetical protein